MAYTQKECNVSDVERILIVCMNYHLKASHH
jgi:hypothetical protein